MQSPKIPHKIRNSSEFVKNSSMENNNDDTNSNQTMEEIYKNNDNDKTQRQRPIKQLDIESYASFYTGRTKILRLIFIADRCDNPSMELEALRMAYDEAKKGEDSSLFKEIVLKINGRLGSNYGLDYGWIAAVRRRAELRMQELQNELNVHKSNLINENICMGFNNFGDFFYAHGQLEDASKNYDQTRHYRTTANYTITRCLNAILISIELGQFSKIDSYVRKAEETPEALEPIVLEKLRCAAGLGHLHAKEYKLAARKFIEVVPQLGNNYSEVIAPQDVATYGGLCALATFDRSELKSKVIDNIKFRKFLELVPMIKELIHDFYLSHYVSCFDHLGNLKSKLLLDIHLHNHVEGLFKEIRNKALIQYTRPFISLDLNMMANAFKISVSELQKELEILITNNQIQARIDSPGKVLYARHADQRKTTFQRVLQTGAACDRDVRSMLLRANIIKHDVIHRHQWMI